MLLLLGGGVSVAVNVGHVYVRPDNAAEGWAPASGAVPWAMAWAVLVPLMLFVAVKGIRAIAWPAERRWLLWRWCGVLPVAVLAGYRSWSHMSGLLTSIGEDWLVCLLAPLAVNGLMFVGVGGLLATGTSARRAASTAAAAATSATGVGSRLFPPVDMRVGGR